MNHLQHVHSSGPSAIVCKSCATHRALITCNMCYVPQTNSRKTRSAHKHLHMYNHKQQEDTVHTNTYTCTTTNSRETHSAHKHLHMYNLKQQEDSQCTQTLAHVQPQTNSRKTHSAHKHLHIYKHKQTAGRLTVTVKLIYLTKHTGVTTTCVELCYINKLVADKLIYLTKLLNWFI